MASLDELLRALFPTARAIGGRRSRTANSPEVMWVRLVRSRVPALEALEAGDLVIVPGPALAVVAPDAARIDALAAALAAADAPAVLLVDGDTGGDAVAALARAVTAAGIAAFALGRADPVAVERSVIGYLVNRRAELDRRAGELEQRLAHLALGGGGLDALAAAIGSFLGRAVVIEGRRGDALAVHAASDTPGAAAAVAAYLASPESGGAFRIEIPAPAGETGPGGWLLLLGRETVDEPERVAADRAAALLALELARDAAIRQARDESRRGDPLPTDGPPWVVLVARQASADVPDDRAAREAVRSELALLLPDRRLRLRGSSESLELRLVAAAPVDDPDGLQVAERVASLLGRPVALSRPFGEAGERPSAEAAARATLDAAERLPEPPSVVRASRLPAYLLLGNVRNLPDGHRQARELLAPILVGSEGRQRRRLETLGAVLGAASLGDAATRLGVHRNTVAYRVARLEQLAGWDLSDPDLRFALHLAVRLVQDEQGSTNASILNRNRSS